MPDFDELLIPDASEHAILNDTLIDVSAMSDTFVYRQNTGTAWQGEPVKVPPGEYIRVLPGMKILANARPIDFGLPGGGDAVGVRKGRAFQIETKTLIGRQRKQQGLFQQAWERAGGLYILVRDRAEAVRKLNDST
ncbi:hypothetical protein I5E68_09650 [Novosphingobium sp. YJ-S2-02]|uniref:VRR-NUC domain-containing protein n=1 Tax=Novosphingobium aureum TaxID=2792964 RepID=A0A931HCD8_9SPHN|nr:hypothetical protein [Novosphingobium aureum]MBH0113209.1 hypothetical protein [Novosphingobium aureum]